MAKVSLNIFNQQMDRAIKALKDLPEDALDEFKKNTPIRSGNARRRTYLKKDTIVADYAYAQRLDEGYSKQRPEGMTVPTEEWIREEVERRLRGI